MADLSKNRVLKPPYEVRVEVVAGIKLGVLIINGLEKAHFTTIEEGLGTYTLNIRRACENGEVAWEDTALLRQMIVDADLPYRRTPEQREAQIQKAFNTLFEMNPLAAFHLAVQHKRLDLFEKAPKPKKESFYPDGREISGSISS